MSKYFTVILSLLMIAAVSAPAPAQEDAREAFQKARQNRKQALEKKKKVEREILSDRTALLKEVNRLETLEQTLERQLTGLENGIAAGEKRREKLEEEWSRKEMDFREISGNVRVAARDLESILLQSPISAIAPERLSRLKPLLRSGYFPDIDDITDMTKVYFDEIRRSGQVGLVESDYVGRDGENHTGTILTLGKFTSIYHTEEETGFLNYSPKSQRFFALSNLPPGGIQGNLKEYINGATEAVTIDISGGAALRQISHQTSFIEHIQAGGPIVWPIILIAIAALGIVIYKIGFLRKVHGQTDKIMDCVNDLAASGDWDGCENIVQKHRGKKMPVIQVISDGLEARNEDRETLESVLQESILREMPRVERGLSVLAVFGAVAPLLGLLGTVTGMIDTFRVITLFGTGDPKLMSGGISEALVTTELGLAVAIPIMLLHTYLSRRSEHIIGEMEEKAVYLTNTIQKQKVRKGKNTEVDFQRKENAGETEDSIVN
ncbi:MAG: biopolymer transporter ExbB [Candidatus Latescibacteria bacterium]|nr:biopolymer transporter ExbB [bacterium]MBD3423301.1 biopolymer transporter ExbB [Candidatus Latescibacterota bacterium]